MDIISQDLNFEPPESREEFEKKFLNFKIDSFERMFCRTENYLVLPSQVLSLKLPMLDRSVMYVNELELIQLQ